MIEVDADDKSEASKAETVKAEPVKAALSQSSRNGSTKDVKGKGKARQIKRSTKDSISLWKVRKGMNGKVRAWRNLITDREQMMQLASAAAPSLPTIWDSARRSTTLALIAHTTRKQREFGRSQVERDHSVELAQAMELGQRLQRGEVS